MNQKKCNDKDNLAGVCTFEDCPTWFCKDCYDEASKSCPDKEGNPKIKVDLSFTQKKTENQ